MNGWNSHGGYRHRPHRMGGMPFMGLLMIAAIIFFVVVMAKFGWFFLFIFPFFWIFKSSRWNGGEWMHDPMADEKRKNAEWDDEKPKRDSTFVGDDGELTDKPKHASGSDDIYYI